MKLVEILARELEEWPEPNGHAWQDYSKEIRFNRTIESDFYVDQMCDDHIREINHPNPKTGVTREMWEAERARIKEEKAMPKANKDGWIRHRGGKCPVDAGTLVDVRHRDGAVFEAVSAGEYPAHDGNWLHNTDYKARGEIMAWRPHKPSILDNPDQPNEALKEVLVLDSKITGTTTITHLEPPSPLRWRDRIRELDEQREEVCALYNRQVAEIKEERSSLVAKLKAEGFVLIQIEEKSTHQDIAQQDTNDWLNWKEGDVVRVTKELYGHALPIGSELAIEKIEWLGHEGIRMEIKGRFLHEDEVEFVSSPTT